MPSFRSRVTGLRLPLSVAPRLHVGLLAALLLLLASPAMAGGLADVAQQASPVAAQSAAADDDDVVDLAPMVVSGVHAGPGLWKIRNGDNTLYLLGTVSPMPRRMEWISPQVESVVARSQEVIAPPSVSLGSNIGVMRGMLLLPSLLKMRKNPDGRSLQEVVPAALYARWLPLKARYLGRDRSVEEWRPIFAAEALYRAAMKESGLVVSGVVQPVVERVAKRSKVPITPVEIKLPVEEPRAVIREFNDSALADADCFDKTLSRIEIDLDAMRARANAWAVGDIEALRALPYESQYAVCMRAVTATGLARKLGIDDIDVRMAQAWVAAADKTLASHQTSFATLPMELAERYLARLRAKGYTIEEPE